MGRRATRKPSEDLAEIISFFLTAEQVGKIGRIRKLRGVRTGEVVRRACEAIDEAALRRDPACRHDKHLTVSLPVALRKKIERLAESCDMNISDVVRRACEAYFKAQLGPRG